MSSTPLLLFLLWAFAKGLSAFARILPQLLLRCFGEIFSIIFGRAVISTVTFLTGLLITSVSWGESASTAPVEKPGKSREGTTAKNPEERKRERKDQEKESEPKEGKTTQKQKEERQTQREDETNQKKEERQTQREDETNQKKEEGQTHREGETRRKKEKPAGRERKIELSRERKRKSEHKSRVNRKSTSTKDKKTIGKTTSQKLGDVLILEEKVVTSTRTERTALQSHLPTTVVTSEKIMEENPTTVVEAASDAPGVDMVERGPLFVNPSIRGLSGRRVSILLDGLPIISEKNMGVTGYFVNIEEIRRLEIVRGPGSVLYGTGAIGGVINILTRDQFKKPGLNSSFTLGTSTNHGEILNAFSSRYTTNPLTIGQLTVRVGARMRQAQSYYAGGSHEVLNSDYTDYNLDLQLGWKLDERHKITLDSNHYFGRDIGRAIFPDDLEKQRRVGFPQDDNHRLTLSYVGKSLTPVLARMRVALFGGWTHRLNRNSIFNGDYTEETTRIEKHGDFHNYGGLFASTLAFGSLHRLTLGMDTYFKEVNIDKESTVYANGEPLFTSSDVEYDNARRWAAGLFAQHEWQVSKRWFSLVAGARFDYMDTWAKYGEREGEGVPHKKLYEWSGNLGLVFNPTKKNCCNPQCRPRVQGA